MILPSRNNSTPHGSSWAIKKSFLAALTLAVASLLQIITFRFSQLTSDLRTQVKELQLEVRRLKPQSDVTERLDILDLKVNSWMNWNTNPFKGSTIDPSLCKHVSDLTEFNPGCPPLLDGSKGCQGYDHSICLDSLLPPRRNPKSDCIVYDFGIRENPEFGVTMLNPPFNCDVFAFDPSPISMKWYEENTALKDNPRYSFFPYGAGGTNGNLQLNAYDWGQVSILRYPVGIQWNCSKTDPNAEFCDRNFVGQTAFRLPVRTLGRIMKKLGHARVDVLKIDVEGAEYMFLEEAIDAGTLERVDQVALEWHHYDFDSRYGAGSSPPINVMVALLERIGLKQFWIHHRFGGWPSERREFFELGLNLMYNIASFIRVDETETEPQHDTPT